jgi:hypothetical protein
MLDGRIYPRNVHIKPEYVLKLRWLKRALKARAGFSCSCGSLGVTLLRGRIGGTIDHGYTN